MEVQKISTRKINYTTSLAAGVSWKALINELVKMFRRKYLNHQFLLDVEPY